VVDLPRFRQLYFVKRLGELEFQEESSLFN